MHLLYYQAKVKVLEWLLLFFSNLCIFYALCAISALCVYLHVICDCVCKINDRIYVSYFSMGVLPDVRSNLVDLYVLQNSVINKASNNFFIFDSGLILTMLDIEI